MQQLSGQLVQLSMRPLFRVNTVANSSFFRGRNPGYARQFSFSCRFFFSLLCCFLFSLIVGLFLAESAHAQPTIDDSPIDGQLIDDFDGVQPSWTIIKSESLSRVVSHRRTDKTVSRGRRSEEIILIGSRGGERIFATHEIPAAAAINEFQAKLWLNGTQSGFQLMVRVRLPRTLDEQGEPVAMFLLGDNYSSPGEWTQLVVDNIEQKLAEKTRVMRVRIGPHLDSGEAYIDMVVLNVFGKAGRNQIWTDDLTLHGVVATNAKPHRRPQIIRLANLAAPTVPTARIRLAGASLLLDDQPWLPRVVTHHGESFASLKALGFNTVWLHAPATPEQLSAAKQNSMWLICPPPIHLHDLSEFQRVAAWCIGTDLTRDKYFSVRPTAQELRQYDTSGRPLLISVREPTDWSGVADIVVESATHATQGRTDRANWISLGSPLTRSSRWLALRRQVLDGVGLRANGFVLQTSQNLQDPSALHQRHLAELVNLELRTLKPWIVQEQTEQLVHQSKTHDITVLSHRQAGISLIRRERKSKNLVVPLTTSVEIPDTYRRDVYLLEPTGLSPLKVRRVAGGLTASINARAAELKLLMTDQAAIIQHYSRFLRETGPRVSELTIEIIRAEILELDQRIQHSAIPAAGRSLLRKDLHQLHSQLSPLIDASQTPVTYGQLEAAMWKLDKLYRQFNEVTVADAR